MRPYLTAMKAGSLAGFSIGLGLGLRSWSSAWPMLSMTVALKPAALGWLAGVVASPVLGWVVAKRRAVASPPARPRWRRVLRACLGAAALAPALLWLTAPVPGSPLHGTLAKPRDADDERPNIILITIDALRADHVGAYGNEDGLTPNLDAFAREATRYDAAYVSSPWTLTSFGSIFTSLPPAECGLKLTTSRMHEWYLYSAKLPGSVVLFHERLRDAGYATAAELTNCFLTAERGWRRGFDDFRNEDGPELGAILTRADTVTENALSWLRLNRPQPFFLWVHYLDPHVPYNSPETPAELRAQYPSSWLTRREYWYAGIVRREEETRARYQEFCRVLYAEEVRFADRWVGELLSGIKAAGLWDSSLIVITSDHGEELFDHGHFEHGHSLYEESLWVPLLVKWPKGHESGEKVTQTVGLIGLGSTFLEAAGVPSEKDSAQGLPQRDGGPDMEIFSEAMFWGTERTALTTGDYKIIYHPYRRSDRQRFEVYDRRHDRWERRDLADDPEEAAGLRDRLTGLTAEANTAAGRWKHSTKQEFKGIDLSDATLEKLRTLGYIGD